MFSQKQVVLSRLKADLFPRALLWIRQATSIQSDPADKTIDLMRAYTGVDLLYDILSAKEVIGLNERSHFAIELLYMLPRGR